MPGDRIISGLLPLCHRMIVARQPAVPEDTPEVVTLAAEEVLPRLRVPAGIRAAP